MKSEIWGPHMWYMIHCISFNYPDNPTKDEVKKHVDFILNLQYTLPCTRCRIHFSTILRKLRFNNSHMKNKTTFSKFCVDLHNEVNKNIGKPIVPYTTVAKYYNLL